MVQTNTYLPAVVGRAKQKEDMKACYPWRWWTTRTETGWPKLWVVAYFAMREPSSDGESRCTRDHRWAAVAENTVQER